MPGTLVVCATPIGNLDDASPRLRQTLAEADVVYCEDTRRSQKLVNALGLSLSLRSYFVGNEQSRAQELAGHLSQGKFVALISDAGTPAVADPGLTAVRAAVGVGATISVVPGPSAVTAAVAVSGLPSERFVFEGFLPRKVGQRRRRLAELAGEPRTFVLFMASSRAVDELEDLAAVCGSDRPMVVARELTKVHEEIWRGTLGEAVDHFSAAPPRGELTVVIGGAPKGQGDLSAAVEDVLHEVAAGRLFSDAVRRAADQHAVARRLLYETARQRLESG